MKIPKVVSILGKPWAVVNEEPRDGDAGECEHMPLTLRISPKQAYHNQADTLLHESVHAISEELQLRMTERQVRLLSTALLQVVRANPALVAYLIGK